MDKILERLRKIKELADRGEQGEAIAAKKKLEEGLEKHGLHLSDLDAIKRTKRKFKYFYGAEKDIIFQIVFKVLRIPTISYSTWKNKKIMEIELSDIEYIDIKSQVDFHLKQYRKELKAKMKTFTSAYIAKHRLFSDVPSDGEPENPLSLEEIAEIVAMVNNLEDVTYHKTLTE
jgi:hypothetical protein